MLGWREQVTLPVAGLNCDDVFEDARRMLPFWAEAGGYTLVAERTDDAVALKVGYITTTPRTWTEAPLVAITVRDGDDLAALIAAALPERHVCKCGCGLGVARADTFSHGHHVPPVDFNGFCKNGHEVTADSIVVLSNGYTACRDCRRESNARLTQRRREARR